MTLRSVLQIPHHCRTSDIENKTSNLQFLNLELPVKRRHRDPQHLRRLLAGTAVELDRVLNIAALLVANELVEGFAHGHRRWFTHHRRTSLSHNLRWQILRLNDSIVAKRAGALNRVFKLSNVTWPSIGLQNLQRFLLNPFRLGAGVRRILLEEMTYQQRNIIRTFPESRHLYRND